MKALNIKSVASILKENDEWDGAHKHPIGLVDFAHEVEQKTKYLTASKDQWSKWVYREKDAFALGYIAFKDTRDNKANPIPTNTKISEVKVKVTVHGNVAFPLTASAVAAPVRTSVRFTPVAS